MTPKAIVALLLFVAAQVCILAAGYTMIVMLAEVNRRLPEGQQISYLFGTYSKFSQVLREYRRLYPQGSLATFYRVSLALGMVLLLAFAWQFGFFG
jgi:hypothetical protein